MAGLNVAKYLVAAGVPSEAIASHSENDETRYLATEYAEIPSHRVPRSFPHRYFESAQLKPWLEANLARFDLVELHGVFVLTTRRAAKVCQTIRKPYLLRTHGALDPFDLKKHGPLKRFLAPLFQRPLLNGAAGVMCTTQMEAERLVTYGARPRVFIAPLPVPQAPPPAPGAGKEFRRRHRIPPNAFVVLFISRLDYKKGLQFLIPALSVLKRSHPELWFVLAGSGSPEWAAEADRLIGTHQTQDWTSKVGFITGSEKQAAFAAADLFALPSLNENFGIVVIEALQAGLPALLSDQVYVHKEITAGGAAEICQPSTESCTAALKRLFSGESQLSAMRERSKQVAERFFSPESAIRRTLEVYHTVLAPSSAP